VLFEVWRRDWDAITCFESKAAAALLADLKHYDLLRPVFLELKKEWPKKEWSSDS
jgi:hypothetical protein